MYEKMHALLKEYGLKDAEIKLYMFLVGNKELTAYKISKETGIHRSTTYDILERLISKGFANKVEKNQTMFYSPNEMSKIAAGLKDKQTLLLSLIPEIEKVEKEGGQKIRFLEGVESRKHFSYNIFSLARNKKIDYCCMISGTEEATAGTNLLIDALLKEFIKGGIDFDETKGMQGISQKQLQKLARKFGKKIRI